MARENNSQKLERGKPLYEQSEEIGELESREGLLDSGYMLTFSSEDGGIECFITKESCEDHMFHYVVAITQKVFIQGHMQTPGTLIFLFSSWLTTCRSIPFDFSKFRKLELQRVLDAAQEQEQKELRAIEKRHASDIVTPAQWKAMRDRKRFRNNGLSN